MPTLLVIDDEASVCYSFRRVFGGEGVTVLTAATGAAGREMVRRHRPDVVVLDLQLPDASGLDVFRDIQALDPRRPVIFVTAHDPADFPLAEVDDGSVVTERSGYAGETELHKLADVSHIVLITAEGVGDGVDYDQLGFKADEIDDVATNRRLSTEFPSFQLAVTKLAPQPAFGIGHVFSQLARQVTHHGPHPPP